MGTYTALGKHHAPDHYSKFHFVTPVSQSPRFEQILAKSDGSQGLIPGTLLFVSVYLELCTQPASSKPLKAGALWIPRDTAITTSTLLSVSF